MTIANIANGQIKRADLYGDWQTNNKDSLYYKSDTIEFIQDINHFYNAHTCDLVILRISESDFKFINSFICIEPGRESWTNGEQSIEVKKINGKQIIEIKMSNMTERFDILNYVKQNIERYPWDIKILKLRRL